MWQFWHRVSYLWREMFLGLRRGGPMNWAAVSTTVVLLFLFGIALQVNWHLDHLLNQFGNQLEVSVYLEPGASVAPLVPRAAKLPQAVAVKSVSKEEAWQELVQELGLGDVVGATELLPENPLVDELKVKARSPAVVSMLAQQLSQLPGVDGVEYGHEVLQQMKRLSVGLGYVSLVVTGVLTISAIAVITTTIRLIVLTRSTEIEIMQLVGATKTWILLPFLLQGVLFGLAGGAIAWGWLSLLMYLGQQFLVNQLNFMQFLTATSDYPPYLFGIILLSFGGIVGLLGSWLGVRQLTLK